MKKVNTTLLVLVFATITILLTPTYTKAATITVTDETTLKSALTNVVDGTIVNITKDIKVTNKIQITGKGQISINGNGHTVSGDLNATDRIFELRAEDGSVNILNVSFNDLTIVNEKNDSRGIDTRTDNIVLNLNKTTIKHTGSGNNQPLTIGGSDSGTTIVNIKNSNLNTGNSGYAIIAFVKTNLNIHNSTIQGWAALYFKEGSYGSNVKVTNSQLFGINNHSGISNTFGTITFDTTDVVVEITDSEIKAIGKGDAFQAVISTDEKIAKDEKVQNTVIISGNSNIEISNKTQLENTNNSDSFIINKNTTNLILKEGVTSNINIPTEYIDKNLTVVPGENDYIIGKLHKIKINETPNGTTKVNTLTPTTGQIITIKTTPNSGYKLSTIKATNLTTNKEIKITKGKFTMPDADVSITVTFSKTIPNPATNDNIGSHLSLISLSIIGIIITATYINKKRISANNN